MRTIFGDDAINEEELIKKERNNRRHKCNRNGAPITAKVHTLRALVARSYLPFNVSALNALNS